MGRTRGDAAAATVLAAVLLGAFALLLYEGRGTTFAFDDWDFVGTRLGWHASVLLRPHNDHLSLVPLLVYKPTLALLGLRGFTLLRVVVALCDLACGILFFTYARTRIGRWPALALTAALVVMGPGAWDLLWPFQIGFLISLLCGVGTFLALDRRTRRGDACACLLLIVAVASSDVGLTLLGGVAVESMWKRQRERLWVPVIPACLYGVWYVVYGTTSVSLSRVAEVPIDVWGGLTASTAAATGLPAAAGGGLAPAMILATAAALRRAPHNRPRILALTTILTLFWVFVALSRGIAPQQSRYLYPTALIVGLLAAEALGALVLLSRRSVAIISVVVILGAAHNATQLEPVGSTLRQTSHSTRIALTAANLARPVSPEAAVPGVPYLTVGGWHLIERRYGASIAWSRAQLLRRPPVDRRAVAQAIAAIEAAGA